MSKHTPGPWNAERQPYETPSYEICNDEPSRVVAEWQREHPGRGEHFNRVTIAHVATNINGGGELFGPHLLIGPEEITANAVLIAAAPDMLEALEDCMPGLMFDHRRSSPAVQEVTGPALDKAKAAIAKAKGEA